MAEGKNQHYVPQRYFRNFSTDRKSISVLRKSDGKSIHQASIKGQASKAWYYGNKEVESNITKIEGAAGTALDMVTHCSNLNSLDFSTVEQFLIWMSIQRYRTDSARIKTQQVDDDMTRWQIEAHINSSNKYTESKRKELLEVLPYLQANKSYMQLIRMEIAAQHVNQLFDLKLLILDNKTKVPFFFSDAPCVAHNIYREGIVGTGVLGAASPGLLQFFPLTPWRAALLYDDFIYNINAPENGIKKLMSVADVTTINTLQLHSASSCIYYHAQEYEKYVHLQWEIQRNLFKSGEAITREIEHKENDDGTTSVFTVTYDPLLPIRIKLSFLKVRTSVTPIIYPSRADFRAEYTQS